jgi:hypothetical protein
VATEELTEEGGRRAGARKAMEGDQHAANKAGGKEPRGDTKEEAGDPTARRVALGGGGGGEPTRRSGETAVENPEFGRAPV